MHDLNSTKFFVKVVVSGSFTAAADALGVPKSTISDKVAELERELGVTLLTRTTRKFTLTDVGAEFFRKAEQGISQIQAAEEQASQTQKTPTGVLRITAPAETFLANSITKAFTAYRNKFPNVKIELNFSDRFVDLIAEGYDLAIRAGSLTDSSLMARRIGFARFYLASSENYLKKEPPIKHPKDLAAHSCIRRVAPPADETWVLRSKQGKVAKIQPPFSVSANTIPAIRALAMAGQGVALLPASFFHMDIHGNNLVRVLPDWATPEEPVHLLFPSQRFVSPKLKEILPPLEKALRKMVDARSRDM